MLDLWRTREDYASVVESLADEIEQARGRDYADRWFRAAVHGEVPMSHLVDRWLGETAYTQQTIMQYRNAVSELIDFLGDRPFRMVTRADAGRFISEDLGQRVKPKTANRKISSLSAFWKWARKRGHTEDNPWSEQSFSKGHVKKEAQEKREFQPRELRRLFELYPVGDVYGDAFWLSLFLGTRINELVSINSNDVEDGGLWIRQGKSAAATRWLPAPTAIKPILERRLGNDWLFPEAIPSGPDGKRSHSFRKRAMRRLDKIRGDDRSIDIHSFRRTYITACEESEMYEPALEALVGHKHRTFALHTYSGGQSRDRLRGAQERVERVILGWLQS